MPRKNHRSNRAKAKTAPPAAPAPPDTTIDNAASTSTPVPIPTSPDVPPTYTPVPQTAPPDYSPTSHSTTPQNPPPPSYTTFPSSRRPPVPRDPTPADFLPGNMASYKFTIKKENGKDVVHEELVERTTPEEMIEKMKSLLGDDFVERYWRREIRLPLPMVAVLGSVRAKENLRRSQEGNKEGEVNVPDQQPTAKGADMKSNTTKDKNVKKSTTKEKVEVLRGGDMERQRSKAKKAKEDAGVAAEKKAAYDALPMEIRLAMLKTVVPGPGRSAHQTTCEEEVEEET